MLVQAFFFLLVALTDQSKHVVVLTFGFEDLLRVDKSFQYHLQYFIVHL